MEYLTAFPLVVNPDKEAGRVTLITRYGADKVCTTQLPCPTFTRPTKPLYMHSYSSITSFFGSLIHSRLLLPNQPDCGILFGTLRSVFWFISPFLAIPCTGSGPSFSFGTIHPRIPLDVVLPTPLHYEGQKDSLVVGNKPPSHRVV